MAVTSDSGFRLQEKAFVPSTDPEFFFDSAGHGQTYAALLQEILTADGVSCLLGQAGVGKTTLLRKLAEDLRAQERLVFLITEPPASIDSLLAACSEEILRCKEADLIQFQSVGAFTNFLCERLTAYEPPVLLLDQAHAISSPIVAGISKILTLDEDHRSLLRLVLSGRPSLESAFSRTEWREIARLGVRQCHLGPIEPVNIGAFIRHRLRAAGCTDLVLFSTEAVDEIAHFSQGVPDRINSLCRKALAIARQISRLPVTPEMVRQAARVDKTGKDRPPERDQENLLDETESVDLLHEIQILNSVSPLENLKVSFDRNSRIDRAKPSSGQRAGGVRGSVLTAGTQDTVAASVVSKKDRETQTLTTPTHHRIPSTGAPRLSSVPIAVLVLLLIFTSSWTREGLDEVGFELHQVYSTVTSHISSSQPALTSQASTSLSDDQSGRPGIVDADDVSAEPATKLSNLTVAALGLPVIEPIESETEELNWAVVETTAESSSSHGGSTDAQAAMEGTARTLVQPDQVSREPEAENENYHVATADREDGQAEAGQVEAIKNRPEQDQALRQKIAEVESRASEFAAENVRLMGELDKLSAESEQRLEELESNIAALEGKLSAAGELTANAEEAKRQLEDQIKALSSERDELQAALLRRDAASDAMEQAVAEQEAKLAALGSNLERANASIERLTRTNRDLMDELEILKSKLAEADLSRKEQQAMLAAAQDQSRTYEQERNQLQERLDEIERERLHAAAESSSTPVAEESAVLDRPQAPPDPTAASYLSRGLELLELGDISAAQLFFDLAFEAGHGKAATALGKTYDPVYHKSIRARGIPARPELAIKWYKKGQQLGDDEARSNLDALRAWLERAAARGDPEARRLLAR